MTFDFALEYIPRRMKELGHGTDYYLRLKHLIFNPVETRIFDAGNDLIIIVQLGFNLTVESDMGIADLTSTIPRECQYEHTGFLTITNKGEFDSDLQFIQVIPKKKFDAGK